jgi:hypothetical protein
VVERSPRNCTESSPSGNADYQWAQFDSEAYFQHYYGEPHPDDELVIRCAVEAMKQARPTDAELDVVDVGTGPNLIPFFCALPRARRLTAWEFAESNVAWLEAEMRRPEMRPQWRHFWAVTREAYRPALLPEDPMPILRAKCIVRQGSIFELPGLRGIDHGAPRRVRSGLRRIRALRKARRHTGCGLSGAVVRLRCSRPPVSGIAAIGGVHRARVCETRTWH